MTFAFVLPPDDVPSDVWAESWLLAQLELAGFYCEEESVQAFMYRVSVLALAKRDRDAMLLVNLRFPENQQQMLDRAPLPLWGISPLLWGMLGPLHLIKED